MYHGTSQENAERILVQGLRDDVPILHGDMLGQGVYFSDVIQGAISYGDHATFRYSGRPLPGQYHFVFVCAVAMIGLREHKKGRYEANNWRPDTAGLFCNFPENSTSWKEDPTNNVNMFSEYCVDPRAIEILYLAIFHLDE